LERFHPLGFDQRRGNAQNTVFGLSTPKNALRGSDAYGLHLVLYCEKMKMIRGPYQGPSIDEIKERFPLSLKRKGEACGKRDD
jgi:hypothetical protein